MLDIISIRKDFPILDSTVYGKPLVYFDNGATTQKPLCVIDKLRDGYLHHNANVHRGVHFLSQDATDLHEGARQRVQRFLNAKESAEIIFTRGTTESINLVAYSFGETFMHEGDEVIVTDMEHHSNIVSWQLLQARKGIVIRHARLNELQELDVEHLQSLFSERTKLVSLTHVSNVLGTVNPVKKVIEFAKSKHVLSKFPVYEWCSKLGEGWYIPSLKELEAFVNFWLGNEQVLDWDADEETDYALDDTKPYYKQINIKMLDAGGTPFLNGVFTSTVNSEGKVYVFSFNQKKNTWSFGKRDKDNLSKYYVGRAFYNF